LDLPEGATKVWPDPFRDRVQMAFSLRSASTVRLEVLDIAGRRVWGSPATFLEAGREVLEWNGRAEDGTRPGGGIYFLRVHGPGVEASRTVVRLE
jgi:flagellar hook assembly protein FlgD